MSVHNEEKRIVEQLSATMLTKLAMNRYKPIWTLATEEHLLQLARNKLDDIALSLYSSRTKDVLTDCADAANYLAMVADVALSKAK